MEKHEFEQVDPLVDDIAGSVSELIEGEVLAILKSKLSEISRILGEPYSVTLDVNLRIFDSDREQSLPLLQTGLATSEGAVPYQVWGDSTPHRYVVNGEMAMVPHDHCPSCWGRWDAKNLYPSCPNCGVTMGKDVKLLLDTDCCPNCEKGTVTASQPECTECSFSVNPDHVSWG